MKRFFLIILFVLLPSVASAASWTQIYSTSFTIGHDIGFLGMGIVTGTAEITNPVYEAVGGSRSVTLNGSYWRSEITQSGYHYRFNATSSGWWAIEKSLDYLPPATCFDEIMNQDETAIDCGGTICGACDPEYCTDEAKSGDEMGIDCGDPVCTRQEQTCSVFCPVGFHGETRQDITYCYSDDTNTPIFTIDANNGVCPSGFWKSVTNADKCVTGSFPTWAYSAWNNNTDPPPEDYNPWNETTTSSDTTYESSSSTDAEGNETNTEVETTSTNNTDAAGEPDGTSDVIITVETTNNIDGTSEIITTTNTVNVDGDGVLTGSTQSTTETFNDLGELTDSSTVIEDIESEEGASNPFQAPVSPGDTPGEVDTESIDRFVTRYTEFMVAVESAPIYSPIETLFTGPDVSGKDASFTLPMGNYGTKSFVLSEYDQIWAALGILFIFLATVTSARMIMVRGFSGGN